MFVMAAAVVLSLVVLDLRDLLNRPRQGWRRAMSGSAANGSSAPVDAGRQPFRYGGL